MEFARGDPVKITDHSGKVHEAIYVRTGNDGRARGFVGTDLVVGEAGPSNHVPDPEVLKWFTEMAGLTGRK